MISSHIREIHPTQTLTELILTENKIRGEGVQWLASALEVNMVILLTL